jgi:GxxExxY protein
MIRESKLPDDIEKLAEKVVNCFFQVHKELGPGLLESVYEACLMHELSLAGIPFRSQVSLPIDYKGLKLATGIRLDLLIDDSIIVEIKAVEEMQSVYKAQLFTYLKLTDLHLGFLVNFNTQLIRDGIQRVVR